MGKEKAALLVYFSHKSHKVLLTALYKKIVAELEKKLKTTVLLVSARNIQSRWIKKNRTQKRPYSRTLTSVQEEILTELLLPGSVISDRTRVRLDGSQVRKVVLDKTEQHFLEERTQAIKNAYKKLTTREIEISFDKEPVYYTLKQGQKWSYNLSRFPYLTQYSINFHRIYSIFSKKLLSLPLVTPPSHLLASFASTSFFFSFFLGS